MRRLLLIAGGLGLVLLALVGGWAVMGRRPAVIPIIEADTRPIRVKPDNPGGMQVAGAEEQALGSASDNAAQLAPAPEVPAPQTLRAQLAPPAPAPVVAAPPRAATGPAVSSGVAPPAPLPASSTGSVLVQLGALESEPAAQAEWQRLAKRMPDLLGSHRVAVQRADRDGHAVWRIRTGGFSDVADATGFCVKVRAKGAPCTLATF